MSFESDSLRIFIVKNCDSIECQHLNSHNKLRILHKNTPCLKLNESLTNNANNWANHLAQNVKNMEHELDTNEGENLFWSWTSKTDFTDLELDKWVEKKSEDAVRSWYNEIEDYDWSNENKNEDQFERVGHFTQVVWSETEQLGFGYATANEDGGTSIYIVTRYTKPGNILIDGWSSSVHELCDGECEDDRICEIMKECSKYFVYSKGLSNFILLKLNFKLTVLITTVKQQLYLLRLLLPGLQLKIIPQPVIQKWKLRRQRIVQQM